MKVVDDARRCRVEERRGLAPWIGRVDERIDLRLRQVGVKGVKPIAFLRGGQRFPHHRRAGHQPQHIERHRRSVAVRIADDTRLQDAIVIDGRGHAVAERIARLRDQQIVGVKGHRGVVAKRIALAARQEEVRARLGDLGGGVGGGIGREERPA